MNKEHKRELELEEAREIREEPMRVWIENNKTDLEEEFIKLFPPEEQPLDDDIPNFLNDYADEFDEYAREQYKELS